MNRRGFLSLIAAAMIVPSELLRIPRRILPTQCEPEHWIYQTAVMPKHCLSVALGLKKSLKDVFVERASGWWEQNGGGRRMEHVECQMHDSPDQWGLPVYIITWESWPTNVVV